MLSEQQRMLECPGGVRKSKPGGPRQLLELIDDSLPPTKHERTGRTPGRQTGRSGEEQEAPSGLAAGQPTLLRERPCCHDAGEPQPTSERQEAFRFN